MGDRYQRLSWFTGAEYNPSNAHDRVFRYRAGTLKYPTIPAGIPNDQTAYAVNEAGTVVGSAGNWTTGAQRAIRWRRNGPPLVLGCCPVARRAKPSTSTKPSSSWATPECGAAQLHARGPTRFLFHSDFGMVELPPPPSSESPVSTFCAANALNDLKDNGLLQATGYCTRNGKTQAVRWDVFVGEHP